MKLKFWTIQFFIVIILIVVLEIIARQIDTPWQNYVCKNNGNVFSYRYGWYNVDEITCNNSFTIKNHVRAPIQQEKSTSYVMLGDSILMGFKVSDDETYAYRLTQLTNSTFINRGIAGFDNIQEYFLLKDIIKKDNNYIISMCTDNDFKGNMVDYDLTSLANKPSIEIINNTMQYTTMEYFNINNIYLYLLTNSRFFFHLNGFLKPLHSRTILSDEILDVNYTYTLKIYDDILQLVDTNNLFFIYHPNKKCLLTNENCIPEEILSYLKSNNISFIDLSEKYVNIITTENYYTYFMDDIGHLTPKGHELTAKIIAKVLHKQDDSQ